MAWPVDELFFVARLTKVLKIVKYFLFCFSLCAPQFRKFDILIIHIKINWIYFSRMQRLCEM